MSPCRVEHQHFVNLKWRCSGQLYYYCFWTDLLIFVDNYMQRGLHSRNKKAMEFIAKGWNALKEVDRVIDYCELNDRRLIPLLNVIAAFSNSYYRLLLYFKILYDRTIHRETFAYLRFVNRQPRRILSLLWRLTTPILMLGIGCPDCIWNTMFLEQIRLCESTFCPPLCLCLFWLYLFSFKEMHLYYAKYRSLHVFLLCYEIVCAGLLSDVNSAE